MATTSECSVTSCSKPRRGRGFCVAHYRRFRLYGDPEGLANPDGPERLWRQVDVRSPDECWEFTGSRLSAGYGLLTFKGKRTLAHRVAFYLHNGHWPEPFCCHHCDNPPCCNPRHLYAGTALDNNRDAVRRGRRMSGPELSERISAGLAASPNARRSYAGTSNPNYRLSDAEVLEIRRLVASGQTQTSVAEQFGIKQPHVSRLVRGVQRT